MVSYRNVVLIIFPMDPFGTKIGGIKTCIKNIIQYSPDNLKIELIGISSDKKRFNTGKWHKVNIGKKEIDFLPVLHITNENSRSRIPLAFYFIIALLRYRNRINTANKILQFHRMEPLLLFRKLKNRMVLFIHGNRNDLYNPYSEVRWSKFPWAYFKLERSLIEKACKLYIVSEEGVSAYKEKYPKLIERISFLPTWADRSIFYPLDPKHKQRNKNIFLQKKNLGKKEKIILFAGRLEKQKDPLLLMEVFRHLGEKNPGLAFIIVGEGSYRAFMLEKIKNYNLYDSTCLFGAADQKKLSNIMRISDLCLLTSAFEGMPRSVLESLACGIPVVTTNAGEVHKVVRNNYSGFITNERDPEIIGNLVIEVLDKIEYFSPDNCVSSIKDYTADIILKNIYRDYEKL